jgi:Cu/Ag efflux protein CusF
MFRFDRLTAAAALLAVPLLCGSALAQAPSPGPAPVSSSDVERVTATATVVAVDPATRVVTLKTENGDTIDVTAGEDVRNFAQIKPGDGLVVALQRSLTYTVSPKGTELPAAQVVDRAGRAEPGELPAAVESRSTSITGTITAVDAAANTISVVGLSGGPVHVLEVRNPERQAYLPKIAPGSLLTVTYTSTVALEVTPAAK